MKKTQITHWVIAKRNFKMNLPVWFRVAFKLALVLVACGSSGSLKAQTAVINPITLNYWTGINTSNALGAGNLTVNFTSPDTTVFNLSVSPPIGGLTTLLSTNVATNTLTTLTLSLFATNVAAGAYSLTVSGSGGSYASYSTNVNLFVVPQWALTNGAANWSDNSSWSSGTAPLASDSVYIEDFTGNTARTGFTNIVDVSRTIQSLILLGDNDANGALASACAMQIPSGVTLSVVGTNGFVVGNKTSNNTRPLYTFSGAGTLVVSNPVANFVIDNSGNTRATTVNMTNLNNFSATVSRFGVGDVSLSVQGFGGNTTLSDNLSLAKTNQITALFADDYSALSFNNSISFANLGDITGGSVVNIFGLGISNRIYADSIGISRGKSPGTGSSAFGAFGPTLKFVPIFSNSVSPTASAYIRGTNGGRMTLLAVGVDSGTAATGNNCQGVVDFRGGTVDMQVDKIWLGRNRTNSSAGRVLGGLYFDWGTINANTIVAGNMAYTNVTGAIVGYILVATNGILTVNTNLILGQTPADVSGFEVQAAAVGGQLQINNGGKVLANKITVGQFSTNNIITVNAGGLLVVSNTLADVTKGLTTLTLDGARLTFSVIPGITNAYVTNLNTTTTASKINIASAPFGQYTNVLMVYQAANQTPNIGIGTLPPGFNNMQIVVDTIAKTVNLVVSTNQPKNLAWRGGQNSQWDHASLNWLDLNSLTTTKFTDGDSVTFDDTAAVPTNITIAEVVNPSQSGTGILVTNTSNSFTFNNSGAGTIGSCILLKSGANSLEIDVSTSVGAQVNNGTLIIGAGGAIANATTATGTTLNNAGTVSGGVTCSGALQNSGVIIGSLSIQTSGSVVNSGTVSGALTIQSGSSLNNSGSLNSIGTTTVATNSTVINGGTIYGSSLTVAFGGTLTDVVQGGPGISPGSINIGTLTINGTFNPGGTGNAIGTTKVTDYDYASGNQLGAPSGRVQLSPGSLTIFKFNSTNVPPYTKLLAQSQVYGPSSTSKAINGCTLLISNVGPTAFTAGQSFKFFGQYYTDGNPGNAGLNTTNSYPIIIPQNPGPGLAWDLSQLYASGTIGVIDASSVQITLTNNFTLIGGTNIVVELSWPTDYIGNGWVQQQITTLTNGLGTNWNNIGQSDYVNDIFLTNAVSGSSAVFYRFVRP